MLAVTEQHAACLQFRMLAAATACNNSNSSGCCNNSKAKN